MMDELDVLYSKKPSFFLVRNIEFKLNIIQNDTNTTDIPPFMHMLRHRTRGPGYIKLNKHKKAVIRTDSKILTMGAHKPIDCVGLAKAACRKSGKWINESIAIVAHFRSPKMHDCPPPFTDCLKEGVATEDFILKFKHPWVESVTKTLQELEIPNDYL